MSETAVKLTRKDFISSNDVRWCPGCGDYAILAIMQGTLPNLGIPKEKFVFVSGIGCSSRFPYYMNTYGFHSIHGRAPTIATGLKCLNPDLSVWVITGDGDGLSIGGKHLIHILRRNVDVKIILFNNKIYGLTKGQYSPTSEFGLKTKSTPYGSIDYPMNPISIALAAEASFVARTVDTDVKHMSQVFEAAGRHKGTAFVEVLQNCVIFNDGAHAEVSDREKKDDHFLKLEHGKPLIFGKTVNKGIRMNGVQPEVVEFDPANPPQDLIIHDQHTTGFSYADMLARFALPNFPVAFGVLRSVSRPTYDELLQQQIEASLKSGRGDLKKLIHSGDVWEIK